MLENGDIILQRELTKDKTISSYTVIITARDNGPYPLYAATTCTVTINVVRNLNPPVFINTPYDRVIERTAQAGQAIVNTTATDSDTSVSY